MALGALCVMICSLCMMPMLPADSWALPEDTVGGKWETLGELDKIEL